MRWWVASVGYIMPQAQWAPTLTSHDPSYVITINSPEAPPASIAFASALQSPMLQPVVFGAVVR